MARDYVAGETRIVMVKDRGHIRIEETCTGFPVAATRSM